MDAQALEIAVPTNVGPHSRLPQLSPASGRRAIVVVDARAATGTWTGMPAGMTCART
jgi:hypothetical protein